MFNSLNIKTQLNNTVMKKRILPSCILLLASLSALCQLQYTYKINAVSSDISTIPGTAEQVIGEPNVTTYGANSLAWSSATADKQREHLELTFEQPQQINTIKIWQTFNPGAIDTIYVQNPFTQAWEKVWEGTATSQVGQINILSAKFPQTSFLVQFVRIALNSSMVSGFNEIDAVGIGFETPTAPNYTSPEWIDASSYGDESSTKGTAVQYDDAGNIYVAGTFDGASVTFGDIRVDNKSRNTQAYLAKQSPEGNWLWAVSPTGISDIKNIGIDAKQNIYIVGNFEGDVDFQDGNLIDKYQFGIYVANYSADGKCIWVQPATSDKVAPICTAGYTYADGNTYIIGNFKEDLKAGAQTKISEGLSDIFIAKIDINGNWKFLTSAGGKGEESGYSIVADAEYIYVAGSYNSPECAFDSNNSIPLSGEQDAFIVKYNMSDGSYKNSTYSKGGSITNMTALSLNGGYVHVAGTYTGITNLGGTVLDKATATNLFIGKLDPDFNWKGHTIAQGGSTLSAKSLIFNNGRGYLVGEYQGSCLFDGIKTVKASEKDGIYSAVFDADGKWIDALSSTYSTGTPSINDITTIKDKLTVVGTFNELFNLGKSELLCSRTTDMYIGSYSAVNELAAPIFATKITLDKSDISLNAIGQSVSLTATILPTTVTNKNINWTSSDVKIASVVNGSVTSIGVGECDITAMATDGSGVFAKCHVVSKISNVAITDISLNKTTLSLFKGGASEQLIATITPTNATNKTLTWNSDNSSVATVNLNGIVTPVGLGNATISATATDASGKFATCLVNVVEDVVLIKTIDVAASYTVMLTNFQFSITPTLFPTNATNQTLSWSSSDITIAIVDQNGKITPVSPGTCTITISATDNSGIKSTCDITVMDEQVLITGITLDKTALSLVKAGAYQLITTIIPANSSNPVLKWTTSNAAIATVVNGLVKATGLGECKIYATATDGSGISAECIVTVVEDVILVQKIDVTANYTVMLTNSQFSITPTVFPTNATNQTLSWSSSDITIAIVDQNGKIKPVSPGNCTITISATDNSGITSTCDITVMDEQVLITGITLDKTALSLVKAGAYQLITTIIPANSSNPAINWTSSNNAVATVVNGLVTATGLGQCKIYAVTMDGSGKSATCLVDVVDGVLHVSSINLEDSKVSLIANDNSYQLIASILPTDATYQELTWESSNPQVALVDNSGLVTPLFGGLCTITATSVDNRNAIAVCEIIVVDKVILATSVTLDYSQITVEVGRYAFFIATVSPADATDNSVVWSSSDPGIVSVNQSGAFIGRAEGVAKITATTSNELVATCYVSVVKTSSPIDYTTLDKAIAEAKALRSGITSADIGTMPGQYPQLSVDAYDKAISQVVSVRNTIQTEQIVVNTATSQLVQAITTFRNSRIGFIKVTDIKFNISNLNLTVKSAAYQIVANIFPADATNKSLVWSSSDATIASVDAKGSITPLSGGEATITATSTDGSIKSTSCKVVVTVPVASVSISQKLSLKIDDQATLLPIILPDNATNSAVTWKNQFPEVASISINGIVKGLSAGSTKITVTSADGAASAVCVVNVMSESIAISSIDIRETHITAILGSQLTIPVVILPYNATEAIVWESSLPTVATVAGGMVQALGLGTTEIKANALSNAQIYDIITLDVIPSFLPNVKEIGSQVYPVDTISIRIDLTTLVSDDNTDPVQLVFDATGTNNLSVTVNNGILTVTPAKGWSGLEIVSVSVTDKDGQLVIFDIPFEISNSANTAPVIGNVPHQTIQPGAMFMPLKLESYVMDDFTRSSEISWEAKSGTNVKAYIIQNMLYTEIVSKSWIGTDTVVLTAKDFEGLTSSRYVFFSVSQSSNEAPVIAQLPALVQTDTSAIQPLELIGYVTDDYTMSENITWTASSTDKVNVVIENNIAYFKIIDPSWAGTEQILLTATDQFGESTTVSLTVSQKATIQNIWDGIPYVNFFADQSRISINSSAYFHGDITGTADSYAWLFEAGSPAEVYNSLSPAISYSLPGKYSVSFAAENGKGLDSLRIDDYITVVGITTRDTSICKGDSITLMVSDQNLHKYLWNTGETSSKINIAPKEDTIISVVASYGLTKFFDTIHITVNQPVDLGADITFCSGDEHRFVENGYSVYSWNNGASADSAFVVKEAGNVTLQVTDADGCVSKDTVSVTLLALPIVDLGGNDTICLGKEKILNAGNHSSYKWNTLASESTISVTENGTYSVTATNEDGCSASDTMSLFVKVPYAEQLGLATFSENGNFIVLGWERTSGKNTVKYEVLRESTSANIFSVIGTKTFDEKSYFWDTDADATTDSYRYKLRTYDACGNFVESDAHRTILVQTSPSFNEPTSVNVNWNAYEGVELSTYHIQQIDADGTKSIVKSIPASQQVFSTTVPNVKNGTKFRVLYDIPREIDPSRLKSDSGPYSQSLSNLSEAIVLSLKGNSNLKATVYPVPSTDLIYISVEGAVSSVVISLIDLNGNSVLRTSQDLSTDGIVELSLKNITQGVYTIVVENVDGVFRKEIVKE